MGQDEIRFNDSIVWRRPEWMTSSVIFNWFDGHYQPSGYAARSTYFLYDSLAGTSNICGPKK